MSSDDASVDEAFLRERWLSSFPRTLAFLATLTLLNAFGQAHWFLRMSGCMTLSLLMLRVWLHRWRDQRRARELFGHVFLVVFLLRGVAFAFAHEQTELVYGLGPHQPSCTVSRHPEVDTTRRTEQQLEPV